MSTATVEIAAIRPLNANWIINQREDLTWFIGSGLIGYFVIALMVAGFPVQPLYILWMFGIDGPHVLATVTRTYCDKQERSRLGVWLWILIPFSLIGPFAVSLGYTSLFYLFAICWQHFHIVKQHFGFVMLYKAKNADRDPWDFKLDRWYLLASLVLPLALFVVNTQEWIGKWAAVQFIASAAVCLYLAFAAYFFWFQLQKYRAGKPTNGPKMLLLVLVVPLQWIAFRYASQFGAEGIIRAGIPLGMFHSLQYHRLLWFHNKNRYLENEEAAETYGFAATLAKGGLGVYLLVAIGLNLFIAFVPVMIGQAVELIKAAVWGFAFTHYVLDARIWHVRNDKGLARALHMG